LQIGEIAIIPKPLEQTAGEGYFVIDDNTTISVENEEQANIANRFFRQFEVVSGWKPSVSIGKEGDITFTTDSTLEAEGYTLNVTTTIIQVKAATGSGFFYAMESLKQLLPISFYASENQTNIAWGVPAVRIKDAPAFDWRGYMLDVSRHFFDK
jgi:hexosaminidase